MTATDPGQADAVSRLLAQARAALDAGQREQAIACLRAATEAAPGAAAIHHDLGALLLAAGRYAEAAHALRAALAADPGFALAAVRLGVALQAADDTDAALAAFRRAAASDPARADAPFREGALLEMLGRRAAALAAYRRAAATRPETALSRLAAIRLDLADARPAEAERGLRALLDAHPNHLEATDTLGELLADAGRLDAAWDCYARVTAASPHYAGSFYDLVRCRRIGAADAALVARMTATAARPDLHPEARARLHLALGKAHDDLGDPGAAMAHFGRADAVRGRSVPAVADAIERRVARLVARFDARSDARSDAEAMAAPPAGDHDPTPILIVGLPRSGTTLVEQILSSHPSVAGGGELPFWTERDAGDPAWDDPASDHPAWDDPAAHAQAASDYLALLRAIGPGAARVTDKMPLNVFHAGLVHRALPRATFVLCRRAPIDVALSIHRTSFNRHLDFPTGGDALVRTVRAIDRLSDHWREVLPPARVHEIRYETLVADPERSIPALLAACGLPWDGRCLHPERNPRLVRTPSKWQVRGPIRPPSPDAWRRYAPWLGPLAALVP